MKPKVIVQLWIDAFNRTDTEALADLYSENAINHQVVQEPIVGRDAIKSFFANAFANAVMVCIPENIFEDGEWAILEWIDPNGLRGCGFFHIQHDHIVFQRGYWDKQTFLDLQKTQGNNSRLS